MKPPRTRLLPLLFIGLAVLGCVVGLRVADPLPVLRLRLAVFDMYQRIKPRYYEQAPVRVIDIDNESLRRLGQWPWPRTRIATLVERLSEFGAAAIAFAIVFAEPDRTSPFRAVKDWPQTSEVRRLSETLSLLPDHDRILANLFSSNPVVLGFAPDHVGGTPPPPVKFGFAYRGGNPVPALDFYKSAITNLAPLQKTASGIGSLVISPDPDGVVRRIPLLVRVGDKVYPTLSVEALRVAQRATTIVARSAVIGSDSSGAEAIPTELKIGRFTVPTGSRGDMWLHVTPPVPTRTIPAWRIFEANYAALASEFEGRIVLIGASASGLQN